MIDITGLPDAKLPNNLWSDGLRSVIATVTLYNFLSDYHFYVSIVYELPYQEPIPKPTISVTRFRPNIYYHNDKLKTCDIIRLILTILILSITLYKDIYQSKESFIFDKIFTFNNIFEFMYILIYWISFSNKQTFLTKSDAFNLPITGNFVLQSEYYEYFYTAIAYRIDLFLECFIFLIIMIKFCSIFMIFPRIKLFIVSIFSQFLNFLYVSVFFIFLLIAFGVAFNNLYGNFSKNFESFSTAFASALLMSSGHIQMDFIRQLSDGWQYIVFVIFFYYVYYVISPFYSSLYISNFRINSLKKGYSNSKSILPKVFSS